MGTHGPKWFYQSRDLQKRQIAQGAGTHNAQGSGRRSRRVLRFCHKQSLTPSDSVATPKLKHLTIPLPLLSPKQIFCAQPALVNCPTQPTCIAHRVLCICQLYFITNPQWKYERNAAGQLASLCSTTIWKPSQNRRQKPAFPPPPPVTLCQKESCFIWTKPLYLCQVHFCCGFQTMCASCVYK